MLFIVLFIDGEHQAVNPAKQGSKSAAWHQLSIESGAKGGPVEEPQMCSFWLPDHVAHIGLQTHVMRDDLAGRV